MLTPKIHFTLSISIRLAIGITLILAIIWGQWFNVFLVSATLLLTFLPAIIAKSAKLYLPPWMEIAVLLFIFSSLFLGSYHGLYSFVWWWDLALHASSGLILGLVGLMLVFVLNHQEKFDIELSPGFIAIFAIAFAIALGALWEIGEFAWDQLTGDTSQESLRDTMSDLILDSLGAILVATFGYLKIRGGKKHFIRSLAKKFIELNKEWFTKTKKSISKIQKP